MIGVGSPTRATVYAICACCWRLVHSPRWRGVWSPVSLGTGLVNSSITAIPGIRVGHWTDLEAATGCTVVLCEDGAVAGGGGGGEAPPPRGKGPLRPGSPVGRAPAPLLRGGPPFFLSAGPGGSASLAG